MRVLWRAWSRSSARPRFGATRNWTRGSGGFGSDQVDQVGHDRDRGGGDQGEEEDLTEPPVRVVGVRPFQMPDPDEERGEYRSQYDRSEQCRHPDPSRGGSTAAARHRSGTITPDVTKPPAGT